MNENNIIDKELEDDIFNLTIKENLFNQIEKEIEYIDETIEYKALLESNNNELNTTKNINISLTNYKTCKSIYEQLSKKDKIAMNAYGTSTVFSDGNEVFKRYCCTIDNVPVGFMEYSRYNDGYTYISIAILSKYRGKPYNIADGFIALAKMNNTDIRYVANKKNLASQKFIEKHPEFKLVDTTKDCYVYEYQNSNSNNKKHKELLNESYEKMPMILSEDDIYCNMSKFKNPYNIIFVCGTSGSGKSTLSKQIRDMYNIHWVSLDSLMFWLVKKERTPGDVLNQDPILYRYLVEYHIDFNYLYHKYGNVDKLGLKKVKELGQNKEIRKMVVDFCEWISKQKDLYCVVEGLQTTFLHDNKKFISYPFIFKGTSMLKAWYRRIKRDNSAVWLTPSRWEDAVRWTKEWKHDVDRLRKAVISNSTDIYTKKEEDIYSD